MRTEHLNFGVNLSEDHAVEACKNTMNIKLILHRINPCKTSAIDYQSQEETKTIMRVEKRPSNITVGYIK